MAEQTAPVQAPLIQLDTANYGIGTVGMVLGALFVGVAIGAALTQLGAKTPTGEAGIQLSIYPGMPTQLAGQQPSGLHAVPPGA